jgi:tetrahydromethanopterin S-methyltransferase subunit G
MTPTLKDLLFKPAHKKVDDPEEVKKRLEELRIRVEHEFTLMEMQIRDRRMER